MERLEADIGELAHRRGVGRKGPRGLSPAVRSILCEIRGVPFSPDPNYDPTDTSSWRDEPVTKEGQAIINEIRAAAADRGNSGTTPRGRRYRCLRPCTLGRLSWKVGSVWNRAIERERLLPYLKGNPTEERIAEVLKRVSPEPTPGEEWELLNDG
jgi:hypothetical protein